MRYTAEVTRENDAWIATVVDLPGAHTFAKNLTALDAAVREVISLVADLGDDSPIEVDYSYLNLEDVALAAARLGEQRKAKSGSSLSRPAEPVEALRQTSTSPVGHFDMLSTALDKLDPL